MIRKKLSLALFALAAMTANPSAAQSPPFNAYSLATLGGNCATANAVPYQQTGAVTGCTPGGINGQVMTLVGGVPQWTTVSGTGTVTSVALSLPSIFSVTGSPITASGTLAATLASQAQNLFFASPNGSSGAPSFRAMVAADVPALAISGITGLQAALDLKAPLASPPLTGTPTAPTATAGTSTTQLATTAFVTTADNLKAPLASPPLTGTPTAPTAAYATNTTQLATTAFVQNNINYINPRAFGAACDTDSVAVLTAAQAYAASVRKGLQIDCQIGFESNFTFTVPLKFETNGILLPRSGITVAVNWIVEASPWARIFNYDGGGKVTFNGPKQQISACWYGACQGTPDSANYIRAMFDDTPTSGIPYIFPGVTGGYNLCTAIPAGTGAGTVGYPASNQASVLIKQKSFFEIDAASLGQAVFTTCSAIAQNTAFMFDRSTDFTWKGGVFVGNRTGLSAATVNTPFHLMNNERFTVREARIFSGYYDAGAFFEGDGNRDFVIEDNIGQNVGQGIDQAFSCNGVYRNNKFYGASSTAGNIGIKGFSHIYDGPMVSPANYIYSGCTVSENVTVENNRFDNYITGIVIQEGKHWNIEGNFIVNMKGDGALQGTGILANYVPSGSFSNVGHTPWNISIRGNQIDGLGTVVAGCGVSVGANAIANSDIFNRFIIDGNMISGSAGSTAICSDTSSASKVGSFFVGINEYSNVGTFMNAGAAALAKPATLPR